MWCHHTPKADVFGKYYCWYALKGDKAEGWVVCLCYYGGGKDSTPFFPWLECLSHTQDHSLSFYHCRQPWHWPLSAAWLPLVLMTSSVIHFSPCGFLNMSCDYTYLSPTSCTCDNTSFHVVSFSISYWMMKGNISCAQRLKVRCSYRTSRAKIPNLLRPELFHCIHL